MKAPEGVEIVAVVYLISDTEGVEACVSLTASTDVLIEKVESFDVPALAATFADIATDFRAMTREEIADYKTRKDEE